MSVDPILDALKSQTAPLHAQLEAHVNIPARLQNPHAYQQLLAAFYGFYVPVEAQLLRCAGLSSAGLEMQSRRKVPLLEADLRHFPEATKDLPLATDLPSLASVADCLGCLYVLEGSTLGSQIIKRMLAKHLAISVENGGAFFNAYGDQVMSYWQEFRQSLSQYCAANPTERQAIVASAQETFRKLDAWFVRTLT